MAGGVPMAYTSVSMPELPEVETIRRAIGPLICGRQLIDLELRDPSILRGDADALRSSILGTRVVEVARRGKHLLIIVEGGRGVVIHLRMTGALLLQEPDDPRRVRAVLHFSNGTRLYFNDMRRLGTITLVTDMDTCCRRLGPEPLSDEFTPDRLVQCLADHRIPVKAALLDQHIVAGVGNMYADEALHEAGIHPFTPANELDPEQAGCLWQAIRDVLQRAIACQGASIATYALPSGERGTAHDLFKVAHRMGAPCARCGTPIQRVMVRKRGAYFCPACQRIGNANG